MFQKLKEENQKLLDKNLSLEKEIEDLKKARWYLDRRIYELEREQPNA